MRVMANSDDFKRLVAETNVATGWSDETAGMCNRVGIVSDVDSDGTLRMMIDDGQTSVWIPVKVCCRMFQRTATTPC